MGEYLVIESEFDNIEVLGLFNTKQESIDFIKEIYKEYGEKIDYDFYVYKIKPINVKDAISIYNKKKIPYKVVVTNNRYGIMFDHETKKTINILED